MTQPAVPPPPEAPDGGAVPDVPLAPPGTVPGLSDDVPPVASPYGTPPAYGAAPPYGGPPAAGAAPLYGTPPTYGAAPPYGTSPGYGVPSAYGTGPGTAPAGTPGTAALVLGIVAAVLALVPVLGVLAVPLGVAALAAGIAGRRRVRREGVGRPTGRATAGVVLGVVAVVAGLGAQVTYAVLVASDSSGSSSDAGGDVAPTPDEDAVVPPWEPLTVAQVAWGRDDLSPDEWWYVVVVDNPNPDHRFEQTQMWVEAVAADGTLIAGEWEYVDALPGQVAVSGRFAELAGMTPDRVEVRLPLVQDVAYAPGVGGLTVDGLSSRTVSWGTTVEGRVSSTFTETLDIAPVVVVATGPDGDVLGVGRGYVHDLAPGGDAPFEADVYRELPAGTTFTAYVSP